jgi:hypothetical protein
MRFRSNPSRGIGTAERGGKFATVPGILCLVLAAGCAHGGPSDADARPRLPAPVPAVARGDTAGLPEATTFGGLTAAPTDPAPHTPTDGVVLHALRDVTVHDAPAGKAFARLPANQLGSPAWVPVIGRHREWAQVLLPSRPNNSTGWLRTGDPTQVEEARSPYEVDVDVDARRMVIREDGRQLGAWTVGVGSVHAPTPRGRTYIMASIAETVTRFSPIILPLGTHSNTFNTYGGGPGTVALHGWPDPSVFGRAASDGCVRVPDDALRRLTSLPLGTLVLLR